MKKFRLLAAALLLYSLTLYVGCRKDTGNSNNDNATNTAGPALPTASGSGPGGSSNSDVTDNNNGGPSSDQVDVNIPEESGPEVPSNDAILRSRLPNVGNITTSYVDFSVPTRLYWIAEGFDNNGHSVRWAIPITRVVGVIIYVRTQYCILYSCCQGFFVCQFIRNTQGRIIGIECAAGIFCYFRVRWVNY